MSTLTRRQALLEAERCLQCFDAPCTAACPAHIEIPRFILSLRTENLRGAGETVRAAHVLAGVCGRVCPEEIFCQPACTRGKQDAPVRIRELHLFATQAERRGGPAAPRLPAPGTLRVAVIGAGPAGLACAFELARHGCRATVFDRSRPGGVPRSSIPSFRLPSEDLEGDVEFLGRALRFTPTEVDAERFKDIRADHDAVFLGVGLGSDRSLGIPGTSLAGVLPVLRFLERAKAGPRTGPPGTQVIVVGGGNVSLDAAAAAKRLGARAVTLLYRRGEREMRVWKSEITEARRQGVEIAYLTSPVEIIGRRRVEGVRCLRMRLSDRVDAGGRRIPEEVPGSGFLLEADAVIVAIGQDPSAEFLPLLERTAVGHVRVDGEYQTSLPGVYAGGDLIGGEGTIVQAVAQGKEAALSILRRLSAAGGTP